MPTLLAVPPHFARKLQHPPVYIFGKTTMRFLCGSRRGLGGPSRGTGCFGKGIMAALPKPDQVLVCKLDHYPSF
jgi:hypothetical protein